MSERVDDIGAKKKRLRAEAKTRRNEMPADMRADKSRRICERLIADESFRSANVIFCFISFGSEIDTKRIIETALASGKRVCVPHTLGNHIMEANEITARTEYRPDRYGIPEPTERHIVDPSEIDLIIVPGLIFDRRGYRIGYGGGYYDTFLSKCRGTSVGVVFSEFVIDEIVPDEYDRAVDKVVTD